MEKSPLTPKWLQYHQVSASPSRKLQMQPIMVPSFSLSLQAPISPSFHIKCTLDFGLNVWTSQIKLIARSYFQCLEIFDCPMDRQKLSRWNSSHLSQPSTHFTPIHGNTSCPRKLWKWKKGLAVLETMAAALPELQEDLLGLWLRQSGNYGEVTR